MKGGHVGVVGLAADDRSGKIFSVTAESGIVQQPHSRSATQSRRRRMLESFSVSHERQRRRDVIRPVCWSRCEDGSSRWLEVRLVLARHKREMRAS